MLKGKDIALAKALFGKGGGGSGGGNPNSVVTVTGTAAAPFGSWTSTEFTQFLDDIENDRVTAMLAVDTEVLGGNTYTLVAGKSNIYEDPVGISFELDGNFSDANVESWLALGFIYYISSGSIHQGVLAMLSGGSVTSLSAYASLLPTTLTLIYHPLTGSLEAAENETFGTVSGGED